MLLCNLILDINKFYNHFEDYFSILHLPFLIFCFDNEIESLLTFDVYTQKIQLLFIEVQFTVKGVKGLLYLY